MRVSEYAETESEEEEEEEEPCQICTSCNDDNDLYPMINVDHKNPNRGRCYESSIGG